MYSLYERKYKHKEVSGNLHDSHCMTFVNVFMEGSDTDINDQNFKSFRDIRKHYLTEHNDSVYDWKVFLGDF